MKPLLPTVYYALFVLHVLNHFNNSFSLSLACRWTMMLVKWDLPYHMNNAIIVLFTLHNNECCEQIGIS